MLTEGSVHKLQDCRDGSSPIGSGTAWAFVLYPIYAVHLAMLKCVVWSDHLKVHPQACVCTLYTICHLLACRQRLTDGQDLKKISSWRIQDSRAGI